MNSTSDVYTLKSYSKLRVQKNDKNKAEEIFSLLLRENWSMHIHFLCEIEYVSQSTNPYDCNVIETSYRVSNIYALYRNEAVIMGNNNNFMDIVWVLGLN